jgi:hypothetical protein
MLIIDFEIVKDGHVFRDAIHLPEDNNLTQDQIEEIKQKRFDDWYKIITAPEDEIVS